jgi:hypothetical protein
MWTLRVYDSENDELVAEHQLPGDQRGFQRVLGFAPSLYGSTPLDREALRRLDMAFEQLRQPGRESWHGRECFLDFDAEPLRRRQIPRPPGDRTAEATGQSVRTGQPA